MASGILDFQGVRVYPDCRPDYIAAFQAMANLATKAAVEAPENDRPYLRINTPLMALTKAQIIAQGLTLGVDYGRTRSCYDPSPDGMACGTCDSCQLRRKGFAVNNMTDPAPYRRAP